MLRRVGELRTGEDLFTGDNLFVSEVLCRPGSDGGHDGGTSDECAVFAEPLGG